MDSSLTRNNKIRLIEAMKMSHGIVTKACEIANVSRETYYTYLRNDEEFRNLINTLEEKQIDFVESKLLEKIEEGSEASIHFYLRYKGKKRGYTQSLEITKVEEQPLFNIDDAEDIDFDEI